MTALLPEIECRRANRALSDKPVPADVRQRILTAATLAPSCFNNQPWRFMAVTAPAALEKIHQALPGANYWVKKAPMVVAVVTRPEEDCQLSDRRDYALFDCGLATQNLVLQAVKEGVFAHPIAGFDPLKVKELFQIPDPYIVITLVAIGYPGDDSHLTEKHLKLETGPRVRKGESEVICHDAWEIEAVD